MWQKFEDKLINWAGIVSRNVVLNVIQHSFMLIFPFMMIGSIFTLIVGFPNDAWVNMLAASGLDTILQIPVQYTTEFISVYLVYAVAYFFTTEKNNKSNAVVTGLIAIFAFMILIPYITTGEGWTAVTSIPFTYTGARGMFLALFIGFGVGGFCAYANKKNWTIKMPDSVPPFVSKSGYHHSHRPGDPLCVQLHILRFCLCLVLYYAAEAAVCCYIRTLGRRDH